MMKRYAMKIFQSESIKYPQSRIITKTFQPKV